MQEEHDVIDSAPALLVATSTVERGADPLRAYQARLAPASRAVILGSLRQVAELFGTAVEDVPWAELRYRHVAAVREHLRARGLAPATVNVTLAALRGIAQEVWKLGLMTDEDLARIRSLNTAREPRLPDGRPASGDELTAVLDVCARDRSLAGVRDAAIIALLYAAGIRQSQVTSLEVTEWIAESAELCVRHDKDNTYRHVYLTVGTARKLEAWLVARGNYAGRMFVAIDSSGKLQGHGIGHRTVFGVVVRRAQEAGLAARSPHEIRPTLVADLLDDRVDIARVEHLPGIRVNPRI